MAEAFAPAAPIPTYGPAPANAAMKTASQCDAEYAANKAAINASGQTKRAFVAACRAGDETIPAGNRCCPATHLQSAGRSSSSACPSAVYRFTIPLVAARRFSRAGSSPSGSKSNPAPRSPSWALGAWA